MWKQMQPIKRRQREIKTGQELCGIKCHLCSQAFAVEDMATAHKLHEEMGCICYENPAMGIYFIEDPDGYWLEIVPEKK